MKFEIKTIFETTDISMIRAVKKLIGKFSITQLTDMGLSEKEAELCEKFYIIFSAELNKNG